MIYIKTDAGRDAIKDRSYVLSPKQRAGLILISGERTVDDVLKMVAGIGFTMADVSQMVELGLIAAAPSSVASSTPAQPNPPEHQQKEPLGGFVDLETGQSRYRLAYPLATQLTASMGLRGFRLNLAVEAAGSYSQLIQLLPKIQNAVGYEKSKILEDSLQGI
jgi:hypothetical protein